MVFPYITALTAGLALLLQVVLAFTVSGQRSKTETWVGNGDNVALLRATRRHGNLAENAGIFMIGFALLELSRFSPRLLAVLCAAFIGARLLHAAGLSRANTRNPLRLVGGIGTYLIGFVLAGVLVWIGVSSGLGASS